MSTKKATKRALLTSILAICLCLVMLIGSTFAWFTDTASTSVNSIQSGTLKVGLQYAKAWDDDGNPTGWADVDKDTKLTFRTADSRAADKIFWEPGCTYVLPELKVVNNGNLALKYKIQITGIQGDAKLNNVIDWTIFVDGENYDLNTEHKLAAKDGNTVDADIFTLKGQMQQTAGNDYMNLSITGIAITVYATQDTVENDSYGNTYDENATYYPAIDAAGLKDALTVGGNISLADNVAVAPEVSDGQKAERHLIPQMTVKNNTTLNLSGKKLGVDADAANADYGKASPLLIAVDGATLVIDGNGEINCEAGNNQVYGINVINGGKLIINSGSFYGAMTAAQVTKGELEINGGFFDMAPTCKAAVPQYAKYVVNCIDANWQDGSAKITIKGGTFVNFDPSANPEGPDTTYVAEGYSVISETKANGDVWYTVVKGTGAVAGTQEDLNDAINNNASATIKLSTAGTYTLPSLENKDVTISGTKDTVINMKGDAAINKASSASFDGVTVEFANENYKGFQHTGKLTYKDCTIKGLQFLYANDVEFINCEFVQENDNSYHIWTYDAKNVTFTNCKFNSTNNSKAVLCYIEGTGNTYTRTFNNCEFVATGTAEKSAIMINPSANDSKNTYTININNCTATGYAQNGITDQTIVGVKETVKDNITVNINGTEVYTH